MNICTHLTAELGLGFYAGELQDIALLVTLPNILPYSRFMCSVLSLQQTPITFL
jgi:hypothetical protein